MSNKRNVSKSDIETICANYRGEIIHGMVKIETNIELILATYFCAPNKNKADELLHSLLATENCTFNTKCELFNFILSNHCKTFIKENPSYKEKLLNLIKIRNNFAHRKFEIKDDMFNGDTLTNLYFEKWKTKNNKISKEIIKINNKIYAEYLRDMSYIFRCFKPICDELTT